MSGAAGKPLPEAARCAPVPAVAPHYVEALEAGADAKAAMFARWIPADAAGAIVDIGCGPGAVAARLAALRPRCRVLGIDAHPGMVARAEARHDGVAHLAFRLGRADRPLGAEAAVCLLSSVLHELAAQGGLEAVDRALRCAAASLTRGGRLIVRDFVRPSSAATEVVLRHARHDAQNGRSFADFAHTAAFAVRLDGARIEPDALSYCTDVEGAYEYAMRKDCGDSWQAELTQRYAFWTEADCRALLRDAGLRIVHLTVADDPWIVSHRLCGRLSLRELGTGAPLPVPAAKLFAVAERA
jgi:SAM-dependent methyltransferase